MRGQWNNEDHEEWRRAAMPPDPFVHPRKEAVFRVIREHRIATAIGITAIAYFSLLGITNAFDGPNIEERFAQLTDSDGCLYLTPYTHEAGDYEQMVPLPHGKSLLEVYPGPNHDEDPTLSLSVTGVGDTAHLTAAAPYKAATNEILSEYCG